MGFTIWTRRYCVPISQRLSVGPLLCTSGVMRDQTRSFPAAQMLATSATRSLSCAWPRQQSCRRFPVSVLTFYHILVERAALLWLRCMLVCSGTVWRCIFIQSLCWYYIPVEHFGSLRLYWRSVASACERALGSSWLIASHAKDCHDNTRVGD